MVLTAEQQKEYYLANIPLEREAVVDEPWCPTNKIMAKYGIVISNFLLDFETEQSAKLVWAYYTSNLTRFVLYIPPGIYRTSFRLYPDSYSFLLPYPHRYIILTLQDSRTNKRCPILKVTDVIYTQCKLNDEVDFFRNLFGSFLPNNHRHDPYFCSNYESFCVGPSSVNIIKVLNDILFHYANSYYNQDYLDNAFTSKAFNLMKNNLVLSKSTFLDDSHPDFQNFVSSYSRYCLYYTSPEYSDYELKLKSYKDFINKLENVRNRNVYNTSFKFIYLILLKSLEDDPTFWERHLASKPSYYPINNHYVIGNFSYYKDFCYDRDDMKIQVKDLFPYNVDRKVSK